MDYQVINQEFNRALRERNKLSPLEKAKLDFKNRLFPGWRLMGGKESDLEMIELKKTLVAFFTSDPQWPYAPSDIWLPIISANKNKTDQTSKYFEYIMRHDHCVREWVKYNTT